MSRSAPIEDSGLSRDEESLAQYHMKEQEEARRQWDLLTLLILAGDRALSYPERYQLAIELGIGGMFTQAIENTT